MDIDILKYAGVSNLGDIPTIVGTADIMKFVATILKHKEEVKASLEKYLGEKYGQE